MHLTSSNMEDVIMGQGRWGHGPVCEILAALS